MQRTDSQTRALDFLRQLESGISKSAIATACKCSQDLVFFNLRFGRYVLWAEKGKRQPIAQWSTFDKLWGASGKRETEEARFEALQAAYDAAHPKPDPMAALTKTEQAIVARIVNKPAANDEALAAKRKAKTDAQRMRRQLAKAAATQAGASPSA
jgi:hypothetical protein